MDRRAEKGILPQIRVPDYMVNKLKRPFLVRALPYLLPMVGIMGRTGIKMTEDTSSNPIFIKFLESLSFHLLSAAQMAPPESQNSFALGAEVFFALVIASGVGWALNAFSKEHSLREMGIFR